MSEKKWCYEEDLCSENCKQEWARCKQKWARCYICNEFIYSIDDRTATNGYEFHICKKCYKEVIEPLKKSVSATGHRLWRR